MWLFDLLFSSISQIRSVEVWISRSVSESPLDFEITRVDCICTLVYLLNLLYLLYFVYMKLFLSEKWLKHHGRFPAERSKAVLMLQFLSVHPRLHMWCLFYHNWFLVPHSVSAPGELYFVIVTFPEYLHIYFSNLFCNRPQHMFELLNLPHYILKELDFNVRSARLCFFRYS